MESQKTIIRWATKENDTWDKYYSKKEETVQASILASLIRH